MAPNMALAARNCFTQSALVIDRFHVVRLVCDAMKHIRTKLRWIVIDEENEAIKKAKEQGLKYKAEILSNGDYLNIYPQKICSIEFLYIFVTDDHNTKYWKLVVPFK